MPAVLRVSGYQFILFTGDHPPPHVHIRKDGKLAKLRLDTMNFERSGGFNFAEQRQILGIAQENLS
ncbi:DUF4160 domain-containing protein [Aggregatilineales bacterium SYSU G02658]